MPNTEDCYGIIPARYDSKRFPGKPLADILGKPMFWHVYKRASKCAEFKKIILATDDDRIFQAAQKLNVPVEMTRKDHPSGTDRVLEAAKRLNVPDNAVVVNIQGDEPLLKPDMLSKLIAPFYNPNVQVTTLAVAIDPKYGENPDQVKVVISKSGKALYFSRAPIPFSNDNKTILYGHIGLYAFRMKMLKKFTSFPPSPLELTEKLEQLRLLENDIAIHVVKTKYHSISVDRPEDLKQIKKLLLSE